MSLVASLAISLTDRGVWPDPVIRYGIRHLLRQRLQDISGEDGRASEGLKSRFIEQMAGSAIAVHPDQANAQHYEVPAAFFQRVLGPYMKYSSAYWPPEVSTLAEAEEVSLGQTCAHASLRDGQSVLELGCGWGSLSLWMAEHFPHSTITAVSNSRSQKAYIDSLARERRLDNLQVVTCDMNEFDVAPGSYDRVVSVEMFEHMRNWQRLFEQIHRWLTPDGLFFLHIFVHRTMPYAFEVHDSGDWMSRYFFTGGMMPSDDLPVRVQDTFSLMHQWRWPGTHYEKTANAWLDRMDARREALWPLFEQTYGIHARTWWMRWRVFFMACAELFGYRQGQEWWVSHYLLEKTSPTP